MLRWAKDLLFYNRERPHQPQVIPLRTFRFQTAEYHHFEMAESSSSFAPSESVIGSLQSTEPATVPIAALGDLSKVGGFMYQETPGSGGGAIPKKTMVTLLLSPKVLHEYYQRPSKITNPTLTGGSESQGDKGTRFGAIRLSWR